MLIPPLLQVKEDKNDLYNKFVSAASPAINKLYTFALRITGNKKDTYNLVQKTLSKAFWFYPHLDERIEEQGWLFRIIRNTFLSDFSRKTDEQEIKKEEELFNEIKNTLKDNFNPDEYLNNIDENTLSEVLASLPDNLKLAIILCDVFGYSYNDAADFIDIPEGTVRTRLMRGRHLLFLKLYQQSKLNKDK